MGYFILPHLLIVSDTTPIHYLILIKKEEILPELFAEIIIPEAVANEMKHDKTPDAVWLICRRFLTNSRRQISVCRPMK